MTLFRRSYPIFLPSFPIVTKLEQALKEGLEGLRVDGKDT